MVKIRIVLGEYEYIEVDFEGTPDEALLEYKRIKAVYGAFGLPEKEFSDALDVYLTEGTMDSNTYEGMDMNQKTIIQAIKRSINRLKNRKK